MRSSRSGGRRGRGAPIQLALDIVAGAAVLVTVIGLFRPWVVDPRARGNIIGIYDTRVTVWIEVTPLFVGLAIVTGLVALAGLHGWPRGRVPLIPCGAVALVHVLAAVTTARAMIELHQRASGSTFATLVALTVAAACWRLRAAMASQQPMRQPTPVYPTGARTRQWRTVPTAAAAAAVLVVVTLMTALLLTDAPALHTVALLH